MKSKGFEKTATTRILLALFVLLCFNIHISYALPSGETVVQGSATFDYSTPNTLKINTASDKLIVDYNSFSIASGESVYFYQPSSSSMALNRVVGSDVSNINGSLTANGIIYLINNNGINIGPNANINTAGFIASTLNIANVDFLNNNFVFTKLAEKIGTPVINNGYIRVRETGQVVLLGSAVANAGTIETSLGSVVLAAGEQITLNLDTAGMISVVINKPVEEQIYGFGGEKLTSAVSQSGKILNPGGKVILAAKVLNNVFDYAVNNSGTIQAQSLVSHNGVVELVASGAPVVNTGSITAGEVNVSVTDTDFINKGTITAIGTPDIINSGNIDIQAINIIQAGLMTATQTITLQATDAVETPVIEGVTPIDLQSGQPITVSPGIIIQANQVRLSGQQFGTTSVPLNISANNIYLGRTSGNIDIMDSLGIGTSVLVRGPPDGFGAIIYNNDVKNLTLEAENGSIKVFKGVFVSSSILSLIASQNIYSEGSLIATDKIELLAGQDISSLGVLKANYLTESGASFIIGGVYDVVYASAKNADNAITLNTGNYSGETDDIADIIVNNNAVITLVGNTIFHADFDQNGTGAFTMNTGSSIVGGGFNFTLYASQASTLRTISGVGTLTINESQAGSNPTYSMNNAITLTNLTIASGTLSPGTQSLTVNGNTSISGTLTITSTTGTRTYNNITINNGGTMQFSVGDPVTVNGNLEVDGTGQITGTLAAGTWTFQKTGGAGTISGTAASISITKVTFATSYTNSPTLIVNTLTINSGVTFTNNGTTTVTSTIAGTGTFTQGTGATFNIADNAIAPTLTATASGNTVNYNRSGAQTVKATTYYNLKITSTGGTVTIPTSTIVNNDFTIVSGTVSIGAVSVTFNGATDISGTLNITGTSGTKIFAGLVTINSGGTWNNSTNTAINFRGGITNNGSFTAGAGVYTFDTNNQTIGGTNAITIPNVTVTAITLTNNGTLTVTTALSGTGGLTQGSSATLNIGGTSGITTVTATASGNSVNYNGSGQTIKSTTYYNLTVTSSGTETLGGNVTINGNLTVASGTLNPAGFTVTGSGTNTLSVSGTIQVDAATFLGNYASFETITLNSGSTVDYSGTIAQTIDHTLNYQNLTISGSNTKSLEADTTVSGNLALSAGTLSAGSYTLTISGNWTGAGTFSAGTGTVTFTGTNAQTIGSAATTFYNLIINKASNTATLGAAIAVSNNLTISSGVLDTSNKALSVSGITSISGTLSITSATGAKTFADLTINSGGTFDNSGNSAVTINGSLTNNGTFTSGTGVYTLSGSGKTISGTISFDKLTVNGTYTNNGTLSVVTTLAGSGTLTQGIGATLNIGDSAIAAGLTIGASASGNTVNYNRAGNQAVKTITYYNLTFSVSGTKTTGSGTLTITGNWIVDATAALNTNNTIVNLTGDLSGSGNITQGTGLITVAGSWLNTGTFTASSAGVTLTGSGKSITGSASGITFTTLTINGTYTNNNTTGLTVSTALSGTGTLTQGSNAVLNITGTSGITGLVATATGNTVNYNAAGAQTVKPVAYYNLTLSNSGAKTMTSVTTISGNLNISGSATMTGNAGFTVTGALNYSSSGTTTLTASTPISIGTFNQTAGTFVDNGNTITVTGTGVSTWVQSGTFTATGTVIFTGASPQIGASNFNNLTINVGSGNTATLTGSVTVGGTLTLTSGTFSVGANTLTLNGPAIAGTSTNLSTTSASNLSFGGSSTNVFIPSSVTALNNLVINNANNVILNSNITLSGTLTLTSGKLKITVNATGVNKTYDGTTVATVSLSSFKITSDAFTFNYTANFDSPNAGTGITVSVTGISLSGANAGNYTLTSTTASTSANITPASLTIAANNATKTYGSTLTGGAGSTAFTSSGLVNGETIGSVTITYGTGAGATSNVGTYSGQVTPSAATGGTFNPSNYSITYNAGNIIVNPAALSITANNASKTYGQTVTFTGTEFTSSGLQNGETIGSVTLTSAGTSATAGVSGSPYTVIPSNATGGTFSASNYTITYHNGSLTVNPASLSITANNVTKTYGLTLTGGAGSTAFTSSGLQNGETIGSVTISYGSGASATSNVGTYTGSVTPSAATGGTFSASNYTITYNSGNIVVTAKDLTVSGITANNKVFDGTTSATLNTGSASLVGVITGDAVVLNTSGAVGNFADASIGTGKAVTISGLTITGLSAGNYSLIQPAAAADIISPNPVIDSQLATTGFLRILLPNSTQLSLYQVNTFIPAGPVLLYHPLTPGEIAFFEELGRKGK